MTLRISLPLGRTLLWAAAALIVMSTALEAAARLPWVAERFPSAIGSPNQFFDRKIGELDRLLAERGRIDCIFLGSSVTQSSIIPAQVTDAYRATTGQDLICYNFGIPGVMASDVVAYTDLLVERYRPALLVYGFSLRDVADAYILRRPKTGIFNTPWVRYRTGDRNASGWLVEHSAALRRYLALRHWPRSYFENPINNQARFARRGFWPFEAESADFVVYEYLKRFQVADEERAALRALMALDTPVLLLEVPLSERSLDAFLGGRDDYRALMDSFAADAAARAVPFLSTTDRNLIPSNGWVGDLFHMSPAGAEVFSRWVGAQLARLN